MDRKEFLTRSLQLCVGCGALSTLAPAVSAQEAETGPDQAAERRAAWMKGWVHDFTKTVDAELDEKEQIAFMQANGRACAGRGSLEAMEKYRGDLDGLLGMFRSHFGEQAAQHKDNVVTVSWDTCLCPLVMDVEEISHTFCHCTEGWFLAVFEMVTGKPVKAEAVETVKRGHDRCKVIVRV